MLVGPDNGLLSLAAQVAGGVVEAVDIARSQFRLEPVSATFHGRDIFAPVAARLAAGAALARGGRTDRSRRARRAGAAAARAIEDGSADRASASTSTGSATSQLGVEHEELAGTGLKLGRPVELELGTRTKHEAHFALTFADVEPDELLVYEDAQRRLAVAVSHGSAATRLGHLGRRRAADHAEVTAPIGTPRVHYSQTDSTNERARELAAAGAARRHAGDRFASSPPAAGARGADGPLRRAGRCCARW